MKKQLIAQNKFDPPMRIKPRTIKCPSTVLIEALPWWVGSTRSYGFWCELHHTVYDFTWEMKKYWTEYKMGLQNRMMAPLIDWVKLSKNATIWKVARWIKENINNWHLCTSSHTSKNTNIAIISKRMLWCNRTHETHFSELI